MTPWWHSIVHIPVLLALLAGSAWVCYDLGCMIRAESLRPFQKRWAVPAVLPEISGETEISLYTAGMAQCQQAIAWDSENPYLWYDLGHLSWSVFSHMPPTQSSAILAQARQALLMAIAKYPSMGQAHFLLAQIYQQEQSWRQADSCMALAQLFLPYSTAVGPTILEYWIMRRQAENNAARYLPWIYHQFRFLVSHDWAKYGIDALQFWEITAAHVLPRGITLPDEDRVILQAAKAFWGKNDFVTAKQLLATIRDQNYLADKLLLAAEIGLYEKGAQTGRALCHSAIQMASSGQQDRIIQSACHLLAKAGYLEDAFALLKMQQADSMTNVSNMLQVAIAHRLHRQVLEFIERHPHCFLVSDPRTDFIRSQCYWTLKQFVKALQYAEMAATREYRNQEYVQHWLNVNFSLDMEEKASLYLARYGPFIPRAAFYYTQLATRYAQKKQTRKALVWIQKAAAREPSDPKIQNHLQEIYFRLKKENQ